jgi:O-antigen/teichoic acid export membrane protein
VSGRHSSVGGRLAAVRRELGVPMYRNAYALMLNTVVNSGLGLLYWIVAARTSSPEDVGRGNALISLMLLVSILTQADFGQALIRFLPRAGTGACRFVLTAYVTAVGFAVVAATGVMIWCHELDPADPLHVSLPFGAWFVVSTAAWSVFHLQDSALTGLRASVWIPLENGVYGLVKLGLLVVVAQTSVADGVFLSWNLPVLALLVPVSLLLFRRLIPRHAASAIDGEGPPPRPVLIRYLTGGYVGHLAGQMSTTFLPVLIVTLLGSAQGGFFLPAQTAFTATTLLSQAIVASLVVEAAKDEAHASRHARAMARRIVTTVWPVAAVVGVGAPWLLLLFGPEYSEQATTLLQLLMVTVPLKIVTALYNTRCRLQNRTGRIAVLQCLQATVLLGGTAALAGTWGLVAVGWAALAAEAVPALILAPTVVRWLRSPPANGTSAQETSPQETSAEETSAQ